MAILKYTAFLDKHRDKGITDGSLRWQIFNAENNGLADSGALIRQGNRIWLDEDKFFSSYLNPPVGGVQQR